MINANEEAVNNSLNQINKKSDPSANSSDSLQEPAYTSEIIDNPTDLNESGSGVLPVPVVLPSDSSKAEEIIGGKPDSNETLNMINPSESEIDVEGFGAATENKMDFSPSA